MSNIYKTLNINLILIVILVLGHYCSAQNQNSLTESIKLHMDTIGKIQNQIQIGKQLDSIASDTVKLNEIIEKLKSTSVDQQYRKSIENYKIFLSTTKGKKITRSKYQEGTLLYSIIQLNQNSLLSSFENRILHDSLKKVQGKIDSAICKIEDAQDGINQAKEGINNAQISIDTANQRIKNALDTIQCIKKDLEISLSKVDSLDNKLNTIQNAILIHDENINDCMDRQRRLTKSWGIGLATGNVVAIILIVILI